MWMACQVAAAAKMRYEHTRSDGAGQERCVSSYFLLSSQFAARGMIGHTLHLRPNNQPIKCTRRSAVELFLETQKYTPMLRRFALGDVPRIRAEPNRW
jgi:hypothetical protein